MNVSHEQVIQNPNNLRLLPNEGQPVVDPLRVDIQGQHTMVFIRGMFNQRPALFAYDFGNRIIDNPDPDLSPLPIPAPVMALDVSLTTTFMLGRNGNDNRPLDINIPDRRITTQVEPLSLRVNRNDCRFLDDQGNISAKSQCGEVSTLPEDETTRTLTPAEVIIVDYHEGDVITITGGGEIMEVVPTSDSAVLLKVQSRIDNKLQQLLNAVKKEKVHRNGGSVYYDDNGTVIHVATINGQTKLIIQSGRYMNDQGRGITITQSKPGKPMMYHPAFSEPPLQAGQHNHKPVVEARVLEVQPINVDDRIVKGHAYKVPVIPPGGTIDQLTFVKVIASDAIRGSRKVNDEYGQNCGVYDSELLRRLNPPENKPFPGGNVYRKGNKIFIIGKKTILEKPIEEYRKDEFMTYNLDKISEFGVAMLPLSPNGPLLPIHVLENGFIQVQIDQATNITVPASYLERAVEEEFSGPLVVDTSYGTFPNCTIAHSEQGKVLENGQVLVKMPPPLKQTKRVSIRELREWRSSPQNKYKQIQIPLILLTKEPYMRKEPNEVVSVYHSKQEEDTCNEVLAEIKPQLSRDANAIVIEGTLGLLHQENQLHVGNRQADFVTDMGKKRGNMEDAVGGTGLGEINGQSAALFLVDDGMGGHEKGELASSLACRGYMEVVRALLKERNTSVLADEDVSRILRDAALIINNRLAEYNLTQPKSDKKPGTTLSAALLIGDKVFVVNIGDSRTYIQRGTGALELVTRDQSRVAQDVLQGSRDPEEIYTAADKSALVNSLEGEADLAVDIFIETLGKNDKLLLCSDGLSGMVRDPQIEEAMRRSDGEAKRLVELALEAGGEDNVSAIVVKNEEQSESQQRQRLEFQQENFRLQRTLVGRVENGFILKNGQKIMVDKTTMLVGGLIQEAIKVDKTIDTPEEKILKILQRVSGLPNPQTVPNLGDRSESVLGSKGQFGDKEKMLLMQVMEGDSIHSDEVRVELVDGFVRDTTKPPPPQRCLYQRITLHQGKGNETTFVIDISRLKPVPSNMGDFFRKTLVEKSGQLRHNTAVTYFISDKKI